MFIPDHRDAAGFCDVSDASTLSFDLCDDPLMWRIVFPRSGGCNTLSCGMEWLSHDESHITPPMEGFVNRPNCSILNGDDFTVV